MKTGNFWWLAGVIAAHDGRRVVGRTRLQKTVKLLQRLGLPTDEIPGGHLVALSRPVELAERLAAYAT